MRKISTWAVKEVCLEKLHRSPIKLRLNSIYKYETYRYSQIKLEVT